MDLRVVARRAGARYRRLGALIPANSEAARDRRWVTLPPVQDLDESEATGVAEEYLAVRRPDPNDR